MVEDSAVTYKFKYQLIAKGLSLARAWSILKKAKTAIAINTSIPPKISGAAGLWVKSREKPVAVVKTDNAP